MGSEFPYLQYITKENWFDLIKNLDFGYQPTMSNRLL
jgi:hypothetical protein